MVKPIAPTPVFEGDALDDLIKYMKRPLTMKEKEINQRLKNHRDVSLIGFD
ncbi:MAG: hypothetical protein ILA26_08490 [Methanobrevibacter sp.]|uniref:hypothetical protein n=1 Tax=Methanobrevibacter sp. TaxID=66852 RepID=UPI001B6EE166|nr:hypothetical protein [Methanobrevibacter sp.]MBP3792055.1 hypothetical protein [Methanobrevibacter sp.]